MLSGRKEIYTDEEFITEDNIIKVLREAYLTHQMNANDSDYLLRYEMGEQPLQRTKTYRPEIDCLCIDNIANEVTEFKLGYNWGYPITLISRGAKDSGETDESDAISLLNECYEAVGIKSKTQELARYIEVTGVGYTFVDINTDYDECDSYFTLDVLDPRNTFLVRSNRFIDRRPILGVTYRVDNQRNKHFTCFTPSQRFEVTNWLKLNKKKDVWLHDNRSGEINPLGIIPIVEYIRSYDRMGCFERQIPEMDNLNILCSDFSNDVDQNTNCVWVTTDIEFKEDENGNPITPKSNEWLQTFSSRDGKTPTVTPLAVTYDYSGMLNNIINRRATILQKCNVPCRNDNSGGSTGIAMSDATGWSSAETSACKEQSIIESCKMNEVKVVLRAIKKSTDVDSSSPLLSLRSIDIKPNIKRQKTYELTVKSNALATLISHGVNGRSAFETVNMFEDVNQAWADSKELVEKYQDSIFSKNDTTDAVGGEGEEKPNADRLGADESDQINNSPNLNG